MKRLTWKKHHKWLGIGFAFFMLMFCVSGVVLNHRELLMDVNVSRAWLPDAYHFKQWNGGLLRGTLRIDDEILIYGNSGIWQQTEGDQWSDFNQGLPASADSRNIRAMAMMPDSTLLALGQFGLYRYDTAKEQWSAPVLQPSEGERFSDMTVKGDTAVVVGRSWLYTSVAPYKDFQRIQLLPAMGDDGKVSLFRTVWSLHSGEMFGWVGKLVADMMAVVLTVLCFTGLIHWFMPKYIHRRKVRGQEVKAAAGVLKNNLNWHDKLGRYTFWILMFIAVTGWCLRPPVLIALVKGRVPAIPYTIMDDENRWHDKLRMLRYDASAGDWLLSTSEGLYTLEQLDAAPVLVQSAPPISVMGLNAWQKDNGGRWLMGSFSGMFVWDREKGISTDYFTGEVTKEVSGPPFGKFAVSGYTEDLCGKPIVVEYNEGTADVPMPEELSTLPMSLWNLALEVHVGRIYTVLGPGTLIYIFFAGIAAIWSLYSGYKIRKPRKRKN